jgi:hypothetical protein
MAAAEIDALVIITYLHLVSFRMSGGQIKQILVA